MQGFRTAKVPIPSCIHPFLNGNDWGEKKDDQVDVSELYYAGLGRESCPLESFERHIYQISSSIHPYILDLELADAIPSRQEREREEGKQSKELGKILLGGLFVSIHPGLHVKSGPCHSLASLRGEQNPRILRHPTLLPTFSDKPSSGHKTILSSQPCRFKRLMIRDNSKCQL